MPLDLLQRGVFVSVENTKILVHALIITRLYNCNSLLFGLTNSLIYRLQLVHNRAARLILSGRKFDHITPLLKDFSWLPVERRVAFNDTITYL